MNSGNPAQRRAERLTLLVAALAGGRTYDDASECERLAMIRLDDVENEEIALSQMEEAVREIGRSDPLPNIKLVEDILKIIADEKENQIEKSNFNEAAVLRDVHLSIKNKYESIVLRKVSET